MNTFQRMLCLGTMAVLAFLHTSVSAQNKTAARNRPNIIFIMTDDQGYGDFGFTGNPYVKTPNIDKLAAKSTRLTNFHQSPVCAPTRASLLTGRYHQRTGVHDTYNNGAIMATDETTLAELLAAAGYKTAIAGKWHLGENYGHRPSEQGFLYSLIHHGGGIGQPGDPIENFVRTDSSYFDPVLYENNKPVKTKGYCTDIFTDAGIKFICENKSGPFFLYLSYNAPHTPLQVPQRYDDLYKDITFQSALDTQADKPWSKMTAKDKADARHAYALITNIDDNVGRVLAAVKSQGLESNTIIIFTTDNGNQQLRFNTGFKGLKASVYEGGTRVVHLVSGKGIVPENKESNALLAHVDVLPTLLEATGTTLPAGLTLDGQSAWPILLGKKQTAGRAFYNAWNRGWPEPYQSAAFYRGDYKLVANNADGNDLNTFELYDLKTDPYEQNNLVTARKELATALKKSLDSVFADISPNPNLNPQRIQIGTIHENPVTLTRQDWAGLGARNWNGEGGSGVWTVSVKEDGYYDFKLINTKSIQKGVRAVVRLGQIQRSTVVRQSEATVSLSGIYLKKGDYDIESWFEQDSKVTAPYYLEVFKQP
ncbi:arylsulfatase [Chryseolinea lacunae]|uniref:Arylsulfatase n=1 Tax=Chryseolinea lacunae TaxID=2801331 RepID=A0ABS1L1G0_9BACT|nr:arylsulfatase [Chryseolinea lacunae]MBL0745548.1 arylsulfatase [Chryseolinea lacunae]